MNEPISTCMPSSRRRASGTSSSESSKRSALRNQDLHVRPRRRRTSRRLTTSRNPDQIQASYSTWCRSSSVVTTPLNVTTCSRTLTAEVVAWWNERSFSTPGAGHPVISPSLSASAGSTFIHIQHVAATRRPPRERPVRRLCDRRRYGRRSSNQPSHGHADDVLCPRRTTPVVSMTPCGRHAVRSRAASVRRESTA